MSREDEDRAIQELYARRHGYFWLPCPLCGREFGGHEWHDIGDLSAAIYPDPADPGRGIGICPVCTAQGRGEGPQFVTCALLAPSTAPLSDAQPPADHPDGSGAGGASEGEGGK